MSPTRACLIFLLILTGLRLAYIGHVELSPDEAYYHMWGQRLDWGYYSKGPGVAALIRAGTTLFGDTEFGVRFFAPILALATSLALFALTRRLFNAAAAVWLVVLLNVTPLFTAGSLLMTIDAASIFFWSASMLTCWLALEGTRPAHARAGWWLLTGLGVGLGFLAKYTNAMELLCLVLAVLAVPRWRKEFRRPGFYGMILTAAGVGSPPVFWNATHAWVTLGHLHNRGRLGTAFDKPIGEFGKFLGAHLLVYSPLVLLAMLTAIWWGCQAAKFRRVDTGLLDANAVRSRFLLAFGLPLVVMYMLLAFKTAGEPNWTAPGFLAISVLAAGLWHERASSSRAWAISSVVALAVALLLSVAVLDTDAWRAAGIAWPYRRDPSARMLGWRATAQTIERFRADEETQLGAPVFLIANRYQLAAELDFYFTDKRSPAPGHPAVYLPESQTLDTQFSFWPRYEQIAITDPPPPADAKPPHNAEEEFRGLGPSPFEGRSALYISDDDRHEGLPGSIEDGFEQCSQVARYEIRRHGQTLRTLRVYACFNYKGLEL